MSDLRAGLIGLGMMGRNHARVLASTEGIDLVGVADPLGDQYDAARSATVYNDPMALIDSGIDLCVVAAPTEDHERLGLALADAGVHAMVEKPLAMTTDAAQALVDAFEDAGLVGAVGHIERFNPALRQLRRRLDAGDLGELYQISTIRCGPFPGRIRDVGVIKDLATHDVDLTAWVAGSPFTSISAQTAHKSGRAHEDLVAATGMLGNGVVTSHQVNWLSPMKQRQTVVTGERGAFVADTLTGDLTYYENGEIETTWEAVSAFRGVSEGNVTRFAFAKQEPLATEHEAFRDAVLGDGGDIVTMRQGMAAVAVAEAMLKSASNDGASVRLPS
ncbi:MAG TPA: Gfo/Idh/MocA family oxidoreductase [Nitriliruptoraceae bacterium]|nr:Gfo/Idh/MocA family oxidoreductase [Nitriliruptoraceae bacterium]